MTMSCIVNRTLVVYRISHAQLAHNCLQFWTTIGARFRVWFDAQPPAEHADRTL
jgi:hypothetical protein